MVQASESWLLRVRLPLGDTHRLYVHPNASLKSVVEQAAASAITCYGETFDLGGLWLSLNKRDPIVSAPGTSTRISSCARRGDLVYLMGIQLKMEVQQALEAKLAAAKVAAKAVARAEQERLVAQAAARSGLSQSDERAAAEAETAAAEEDIMQQALMLSRQEEEWDFGVDLVEAVELRHALLASMQIGMQDGVASEFAYLDGASSVDHDCFSQDGEWVEVGPHSGMSASPENFSDSDGEATNAEKVESSSGVVAV